MNWSLGKESRGVRKSKGAKKNQEKAKQYDGKLGSKLTEIVKGDFFLMGKYYFLITYLV